MRFFKISRRQRDWIELSNIEFVYLLGYAMPCNRYHAADVMQMIY